VLTRLICSSYALRCLLCWGSVTCDETIRSQANFCLVISKTINIKKTNDCVSPIIYGCEKGLTRAWRKEHKLQVKTLLFRHFLTQRCRSKKTYRLTTMVSFGGEVKSSAPCRKILRHVKEPWRHEKRYL
jgi:hypothetical protein